MAIEQDAPTGKRQVIRFIPDVSMGTIIQIASMLLVFGSAWAQYQSDKATTRLELDQVKAQLASEKSTTKEALGDIKADVKQIQATVTQMNLTLVVIQANQPKPRQ